MIWCLFLGLRMCGLLSEQGTAVWEALVPRLRFKINLEQIWAGFQPHSHHCYYYAKGLTSLSLSSPHPHL